MIYRCQRFNTKNKLGFKRKEQKGNRSAPWSGAPDCPVCHRTVSGAPGVVHSELHSFEFLRRSSAIIHRTVRCTTRATAICAQRSTLMDEQCSTVMRQKSEQKVRGAPDCPVWHRTIRCRMRTKPPMVDQLQALTTGDMAAHRTLSSGAPDCPVRPSPAAFSNGYNLVGGYKYYPNRPLQGVGVQATFQVI
jgi:hypothetical protein